jgi:glycerol-3-phosphate acyltransferase PlsY
MITYLDILMPIVTFICAYLIGSIPISVIFGKILHKQNIMEHGSKNPGGTNATRLWGKKIGFAIILLDILKGALPIWIAICVFRLTELKTLMLVDSNSWAIWLAALGSVVGHCFSIFLKFKGGKGVATTVGAFASTSVLQLIVGIITFFTTLKIKKMVSLASIIITVIGSCLAWTLFILSNVGYANFVNNSFVFDPNLLSINLAYPIVLTLICVVVTIRHSQNIVRMLKGTERTIK